jgi:hypothetical protein
MINALKYVLIYVRNLKNLFFFFFFEFNNIYPLQAVQLVEVPIQVRHL